MGVGITGISCSEAFKIFQIGSGMVYKGNEIRTIRGPFNVAVLWGLSEFGVRGHGKSYITMLVQRSWHNYNSEAKV